MWLVFILCGTYVGEINVFLKPPKLIYYVSLPLKQWSICLSYFITIPEAAILHMRSRDLNQLWGAAFQRFSSLSASFSQRLNVRSDAQVINLWNSKTRTVLHFALFSCCENERHPISVQRLVQITDAASFEMKTTRTTSVPHHSVIPRISE